MAISTVIQVASLAFWLPLEIYQMETLGHPTFVIALRMKNIVAFALGKMDAWGLNNHAMTEDPWDYVHITDVEFSAVRFAPGRRGAGVGGDILPSWCGIAGLAALAATLWQIRGVLRRLAYRGLRLRPEAAPSAAAQSAHCHCSRQSR